MNVFKDEFIRYKRMINRTLEQLTEDEVFHKMGPSDNSIAIIVHHLTGNLKSRFTNFLTSDGEKEWRERDAEFSVDNRTFDTLLSDWNEAWHILNAALSGLEPQDMEKLITIRTVSLSVQEALARSLAHFAYHAGEIVFIAKHLRGLSWEYLSIPPGKSRDYNKNPNLEKGAQKPDPSEID